MISKTEAIALRHVPFSNTSRVVSWLTPERGRIVTLVKGSQRPRSWFLGQYDLFYTCELLFYTRDRTGLHIARECSPIVHRPSLRRRWKAAAAASYVSDLLTRVSPPEAPAPELYRFASEALDHLETGPATASLVHWLELRLLDRLGLAPRLSRCLRCGRELRPDAGHSHFSYSEGGLLCESCIPRDARSGMPLGRDAYALLSAWQVAREPPGAGAPAFVPRALSEIGKVLGLFLAYHLDTALPSRKIALDILRIRLPDGEDRR
jgi:DNA repair protein RecO (recombination protein O)